MTVSANPPKKHNPFFFHREPDGTVRVRLRFTAEEAAQFEEAAGTTPVVTWMHQVLGDTAREEIEEQRRRRPRVGPPR